LYLTDALCDAGHAFLGVGQRQEIVWISAADPRPAEMIGNPCRLEQARKIHAGATDTAD